MEVSQKFKNSTAVTAIPLFGIYLKELSAITQGGICTHMFSEALFTIAKIRKQPKCPLMG